MSTEKLNINQWAEEDRPREKMMAHGASVLTDAELLAILIGSGSSEETAVSLMRRVLSACGNSLNELGKLSLEQLCEFKGIGPAKAVTVMAACELGRRRKLAEVEERKVMLTSRDIYDYFHSKLADLPIEEFWVMLLNNACKLMDARRVATGGITEVVADVRLVLREALLGRATSIVLCHNHPSGSTRPSRHDDLLTDRLRQACEVMNIRLMDHVIVTDGRFYSYADEGKV